MSDDNDPVGNDKLSGQYLTDKDMDPDRIAARLRLRLRNRQAEIVALSEEIEQLREQLDNAVPIVRDNRTWPHDSKTRWLMRTHDLLEEK